MKTNPSKETKGRQYTTLTVSILPELKARLQAAAEADKRNLSNFVVTRLEKLMDEIDEGNALRLVAEPDTGAYQAAPAKIANGK